MALILQRLRAIKCHFNMFWLVQRIQLRLSRSFQRWVCFIRLCMFTLRRCINSISWWQSCLFLSTCDMRCIKGTFIARLQTEVVSGINSLPVASGGGECDNHKETITASLSQKWFSPTINLQMLSHPLRRLFSLQQKKDVKCLLDFLYVSGSESDLRVFSYSSCSWAAV